MNLRGLVRAILRILPLYDTHSFSAHLQPGASPRTPEAFKGVGYLHSGTLRRLEMALYYIVIIPLIAFLPARLAYDVASLRAKLLYIWDVPKRKRILRSLEGVLGNQLSQKELTCVARDHFRIRSSEVVDVMRLAGNGQALAQLVEMRGLEHIEAALAAGKGAILCSAHFGSYDSSFSLLGVRGLPITIIGRWPSKSDGDRSSIERFIFRHTYQKPISRHLHRPNIEPRPGQFGTAVQAAYALRQNELIGILLDPPVLPADRPRAIQVNFLNGKALLLPGAITLAKLTAAPVHMVFMHRSEDWQHQILEISPPVSMDGDTTTAFERCLAVVGDMIRKYPAHWRYWNPVPLVQMGLLPKNAMEEFE
jgi:KDO2-lipid IV(A) lauroyltransferase